MEKPALGKWYWVRYESLDGPTDWTPALCKGNFFNSVAFSGIPLDECHIGAELVQHQPITWPKGREAGRMGDMTPQGQSHMRVGFDGDNDVYVSIFNGERESAAALEFCTPGNGGGSSPRTREALIAVMVAMEADSAETPSRAFPPVQAITTAAA